MKKFFSFVIVAAAVAMVGCAGNSTKPAEAEVVETEVVAEEAPACADSTACADCAGCDSTACDKAAEEGCCNK